MSKQHGIDTTAAIQNGIEIYAVDFREVEWENLKNTYNIGEILMPCCSSPAVPKTSPNGLQFFSHYNNECANAPETIWHKNTKDHLAAALRKRGIEPKLEFAEPKKRKWQADVFFAYQGQSFVFEVQRSYQHLREYLKRQQRYQDDGIKAFWILRSENYMTLCRAMTKHRFKHEFSNKWPEDKSLVGVGCLPQLPVVYAVEEPFMIKGGAFLSAECGDWISAILEGRFSWHKGTWSVR